MTKAMRMDDLRGIIRDFFAAIFGPIKTFPKDMRVYVTPFGGEKDTVFSAILKCCRGRGVINELAPQDKTKTEATHLGARAVDSLKKTLKKKKHPLKRPRRKKANKDYITTLLYLRDLFLNHL